ncbi:MAG: DsbE family thiol:disulfide interchange protein [Gammaproteobacteria bacterium]|nr:DsbE family thiol:disulfide interchange protein [Gammaproteobacteria bacterium]NNL00254.1 DsbE family thiol:disulfide interchange protein [Xanthomonadales bacterium]
MSSRIIPLAAFLLLVALLVVGLKIADKKTQIPSPLIDKPVPEFDLPVLGQAEQRMSAESFLGRPYLVNFWGSWCVTCRVEHPVITQLARMGVVDVVGLNFRDEEQDALAWLRRFGNPYSVTLVDFDGRTSIDFGVYAAPETFLVDSSGKIVFKHLGQMTMEVIETEILPRLASMESGT